MTPTYYLHRKTGGIYAVLNAEYVRRTGHEVGEQIMPMYAHVSTHHPFGQSFTVCDPICVNDLVAFYVNAVTGERWARPYEMFHDGRFAMFDGVPDLPGLIPLP